MGKRADKEQLMAEKKMIEDRLTDLQRLEKIIEIAKAGIKFNKIIEHKNHDDVKYFDSLKGILLDDKGVHVDPFCDKRVELWLINDGSMIVFNTEIIENGKVVTRDPIEDDPDGWSPTKMEKVIVEALWDKYKQLQNRKHIQEIIIRQVLDI